tara:strand:+ start:473 stop:679 length:207 start_codon:yes stop_codon:yes gene_type:complete
MKPGTLIKSENETGKLIGVVYNTNKHYVSVHWTDQSGNSSYQEEILLVNLNKWIIAGFIEVIGSQRTS